MNYILYINFLILFPTFVLSCKSKTPEPVKEVTCPDGFWKVPDEWKCMEKYREDTVDCANDYQCMNYAYLCDGERNLKRRDNKDDSYKIYLQGSPDENLCTDEFCSTLTDGRTRRCPGTTRCIPPIVHYHPGTDIPIGPICAEELFDQFKTVEAHFLENGSSPYSAFHYCQNGETVKLENWGDSILFRVQTSQRCRQENKPLCTDNSDVTAKTCAWACLHFSSKILRRGHETMSWPCPGEAKCIGRDQICDGVSDCDNGQDEDKNLCTREFCNNGFVSYDSNRINISSKPYRWGTDLGKMTQDHLFTPFRTPSYIDYYRTQETDFNQNKLQNMEEELQKLELVKCKNSTKCRRFRWINDGANCSAI